MPCLVHAPESGRPVLAPVRAGISERLRRGTLLRLVPGREHDVRQRRLLVDAHARLLQEHPGVREGRRERVVEELQELRPTEME